MSWKSIFGSELNLSLLELALALAGSSILMLSAVLLFLAYNFFENEIEQMKCEILTDPFAVTSA